MGFTTNGTRLDVGVALRRTDRSALAEALGVR
jgi:hypothetical protein